jgi:hypothetical protein
MTWIVHTNEEGQVISIPIPSRPRQVILDLEVFIDTTREKEKFIG